MQETWREVRSGNANGIIDTVRSNPVPAGMVALGLGMLFMSRGQRAERWRGGHMPADASTYSDRGQDGRSLVGGIASSVTSTVGQVGGTVGRAAEEAGQRVSGVAEEAGQRVGALASTAGETAEDLPRQAGQLIDEGTSQVRRMLDESPLIAGLAAVAAGAVLGLVLPSTQMERRTLGQARDDLVERAQQTANELVDKAEQAASQPQTAMSREIGSAFAGDTRSSTSSRGTDVGPS
jgi:hypothetical protein